MKLVPTLLTLPTNERGRDFVVGDIHGNVSKLTQQLKDIGFDSETDRLICVGDLVDRGPESAEALELLKEPWFYSVLGNHEYLMIMSLRYHDSRLRLTWITNGGEWITDTPSTQWQEWLDKIENLPIGIQTTSRTGVDYGIVHADYPRSDWSEFARMTDEEVSRAIWGRDAFKKRSNHKVKGIDWLVHGHNISEGELILGNRSYIEPGAYLGNDFIIKELV